jgi:hypothetical protein
MRGLTFRAGTVGLVMVAAGSMPALAQRAVQVPSADVVAAPSAPSALPPPGMENALVWGGEFATHFQAEVAKPTGTSAKGTVFNDSNLDLYANYSTWLSLYSTVRLERNRNDNINDYFPDRNTAFRSEGVTMRQLFAAVRPTGDLTVYGGKIHPNFGWAFNAAPGNFYNFGSDYEQDERIGFGVEYRLPELFGLMNARLTLETFYLDTSLLSTSLLSQPQLSDPTADRLRRYTRDQFGPSNTGSFDSWTAALRGGQPGTGLTYQVSFTEQGTADPTGKTEYGGSVGLLYDPSGGNGIPLGKRLGVTPFIEYAQFRNFQGVANQDARYLIGGLTFKYVRWEVALAGGLRKWSNAPQDDGSLADVLDRQANLSVNYAITPSLTVGAGVNYVNVAGRGSWAAGPSLSYNIAF